MMVFFLFLQGIVNSAQLVGTLIVTGRVHPFSGSTWHAVDGTLINTLFNPKVGMTASKPEFTLNLLHVTKGLGCIPSG